MLKESILNRCVTYSEPFPHWELDTPFTNDLIKELIDERASGFKDPEQYKKWIFSSEEQLKNIESIALEEQVTELISSEAKCESEKLNFEEIMSMS